MFVQRMREKLSRLREMSYTEVAHRLREQCRKEVDRIRFKTGVHDRDVEISSLKTWLQNGPARRFYASTRERKRVLQLGSESRARYSIDLLDVDDLFVVTCGIAR